MPYYKRDTENTQEAIKEVSEEEFNAWRERGLKPPQPTFQEVLTCRVCSSGLGCGCYGDGDKVVEWINPNFQAEVNAYKRDEVVCLATVGEMKRKLIGLLRGNGSSREAEKQSLIDNLGRARSYLELYKHLTSVYLKIAKEKKYCLPFFHSAEKSRLAMGVKGGLKNVMHITLLSGLKNKEVQKKKPHTLVAQAMQREINHDLYVKTCCKKVREKIGNDPGAIVEAFCGL